jgi:hypothetical protein
MKKGGFHSYLRFFKIDLSKFSTEWQFEASAILLLNFPDYIYIISIYTAPSSNFTSFLKNLESILNLLFINNAK